MASAPHAATEQPQRPTLDPAWTGDELRANPHEHAEKAAKVRRMFGAIARRYDLNNRLHSFWRDQAWRRQAVREAAVRPGDHVLDIACGTGDLARLFAKTRAERVVGADFTPEMLDIARRRARGHGGRPVEWIEADSMALPFPDASFDIVSIAFGIRNVSDPAQALREFRRVLRPHGRLVILEFDRPRSPLLARLNDLYCGRIMPFTASLISRDRSGAYYYLPRSVGTFLGREAMVEALRAAGFTAVTQRPLTFGVCVCHRGVVAARPLSAPNRRS